MAKQKVCLKRANFEEADSLAEICKKAFDNISMKYNEKKEGPPMYDDPLWHIISMKEGVYFSIFAGDKLIGAIIIAMRDHKDTAKGPKFHWELVQMFVDPDYQNRGVGSFAIKKIEEYFPELYLFSCKRQFLHIFLIL